MGRLVRSDGKGTSRLVKARTADPNLRPINKWFTVKVLLVALPIALLTAIPIGFATMVKLTWDFWRDNARAENPEGIFSDKRRLIGVD